MFAETLFGSEKKGLGSKMKPAWVRAKTRQQERGCWFTYFAAERGRGVPAGGCVTSLLVPFLCL